MGFYDDALSPTDTLPIAPGISPARRGTYDDALAPPVEPPPPAEDPVVRRGGLLPVSRTQSGKLIWDWGSGVTGDIGRAFTLPGRVASGETPMPQLGTRDPNAYNQIIPEAINFGQTFAPITPGITAGAKIIPGASTNVTRPVREAPSAATLEEIGGRGFEQFRNLPFNYNPDYMGVMANTIEQKLIDKGIYRNDAPNIYAATDMLRGAAAPRADGSTVVIPPAGIHSLRRHITNQFGKQGEHQLAPAIALEELDNFIKAPPEGAILARSPPAQAPGQPTAVPSQPSQLDLGLMGRTAGQIFEDARGNYAAAQRGQAIADLQRAIDLRTAAAHSGRNLDNTTRGKIAGLALDERASRGFIPSEINTLEGGVYGDPWTNRARDVSKKLGGGGGLGYTVAGGLGAGAATGLGAMVGIPPWFSAPIGYMAPGAIGSRLGSWAANRTQGVLDAVSEATRRRSPYYESLPPLPPQTPGGAFGANRDAIARSLMLGTMPAPPERIYVSPNQEDRT